MITQAAMGVLALALGVLTVAGSIRLLGTSMCLRSCLDRRQRWMLLCVRPSLRSWWVTSTCTMQSRSIRHPSTPVRMIGPAVAGLVIAKVGTGWAFVVNGLSFAAVLISMSMFRVTELFPITRARRAGGGFLEGFRYIWGRRDLRAILAMLFLIGTFGLNFPIFTSTMAVKVFHTDARGFGLLSSIMAVGTISGALIAAGREKPGFGSLLMGSAVFGIGCTFAALAPGYWWFAAALVIIGVAALTLTNATNSMMQLTTEPAMRGRVMAFASLSPSEAPRLERPSWDG